MLHLQLYRVWKLGNMGFTNDINRFLSFSRLTNIFAELFTILCRSMGGHSFRALHIELKGFPSFSSWMLRANFNNYFEISFSHLVGMVGPQCRFCFSICFGLHSIILYLKKRATHVVLLWWIQGVHFTKVSK